MRPPIFHRKCILSRGVASYWWLKPIHLSLDLDCQVAFPEGVASRYGCFRIRQTIYTKASNINWLQKSKVHLLNDFIDYYNWSTRKPSTVILYNAYFLCSVYLKQTYDITSHSITVYRHGHKETIVMYCKWCNYHPGGAAFSERGGESKNEAYCTFVGDNQNYKNHYIILHLSIIWLYVENAYILYILVHKIFFFIFIE